MFPGIDPPSLFPIVVIILFAVTLCVLLSKKNQNDNNISGVNQPWKFKAGFYIKNNF